MVVYVRELGATSFTEIVRVLVVVPPLFAAATIYVPEAVTVVGVPEIIPVAVFKLIPNGKAGVTE